MKAYVREFSFPDDGFTPDGEMPLTNIEKGLISVDIAFSICTQNRDDLYIISVDGGVANNTIPGSATSKLVKNKDSKKKHYELKAEGVLAHSCNPEKGDSAIINLYNLLVEMSVEDNGILAACKVISKCFSDYEGRDISLYDESEYYNGEFIHRTVFSAIMIDTQSDHLHLHLNSRTSYGTDEEKVLATVNKVVDVCGGKFTNVESMPSIFISKDKPYIQAFAKAYETAVGKRYEFTLAYGGSYAKNMPNIVSWGPISS